MKFSQYKYLSNVPEYPQASKGYQYEIYTAAEGDYEKYTNRWKNEEARIQGIAQRVLEREEWEDLLLKNSNTKALPHLRLGRGGVQIAGTVTPYVRDLGGLHVYGYSPKENNEILHYAWLDYCYFEQCNFASEDGQALTDSLFYDSVIHHTRFERCSFINNSFSFGEFKYCVFSNCHFENFNFGRLPRGKYDSILFSNCYFKNVDFRGFNINAICFSGNCVFENIQINKEDLARYSEHIGGEITARLKKWDHEAYHGRRHASVEMQPALRKRKYQSLLDAYFGLSVFYRTVSLMEEVNGFHKNYIDWQYLYNWTHGEARRLSSSSWWPRFRELISRYLIGYGAKPDRPMIAWLILNLVFSWLYLLSGIKYADKIIRREIGFDRTQVWNTLKDYCLCLYYSAITSTTVGYGDISPAPGVSMLICAVHAVLGLLLITMFTVIFARRFFK